MSYLVPPPNMSPVVVVKDFGGYVDQYAARTEEYRRTGREVRIHECHSACTMALSLPNVCVYPDSIFKFHQAYDPRNHVTNWEVSDQLFNTYPVAVRERLGTLTKQMRILKGGELIDLGVRNCNEPQPRIMLARATARPIPDGVMGAGSGSTFSMLTGKLQGMIPDFGARPEPGPGPTVRPAKRTPPPIPDEMLEANVPLPPARPGATETAQLATSGAKSDEVDPTPPGGIPLPPPRPKTLLVAFVPSVAPIPYLQRIEGSQPILPARFVPFPKRA